MIPEIELTRGDYAAKWGLADFYEGSEKVLRDVLASGQDFCTSYGCKKEIRYATITRANNAITVSVVSHMDDFFEEDDLIYDALWECFKIEDPLPDEVIDSIRSSAMAGMISDYSNAEKTLPGSATFEEICEAISALEDETENNNSRMFQDLKIIVEEFYKNYLSTR